MADHEIKRCKRYVILVKNGDPKAVRELRHFLARFLDSPAIPFLLLSGQHYEIVSPDELSGDIAYTIESVKEE